jgi:hypothetical protein
VVQLLYIVASDRPDLATTLRREFGGEGAVQVVVERRAGERRRVASGTPDDRRRGADRRQTAQDRRDLALLGYVRILRSDP